MGGDLNSLKFEEPERTRETWLGLYFLSGNTVARLYNRLWNNTTLEYP